MPPHSSVPDPSGNGEVVHATLPVPRPTPPPARRPELLPGLPLPTSALAAAGGFVAGAATLITLRVARRSRLLPGGRRRARRALQKRNVVATRSFLVDVHLLGR
jgi:hypothetical protein